MHTHVLITVTRATPIAAALATAVTVLLAGCTTSSTVRQGALSAATSGPAPSATTASGSPGAGAMPAPSTSLTASPGAESAAARACDGASLSLSASHDSAGGPFDYIVIEFTNHGSAACTIEGYPDAAAYGVTSDSYVFNSSRRLTGNVGDQYKAPEPITLSPGASASTILEWTDKPTANHPDPHCLSYREGTFHISAPGTKQTTYIPLAADVCADLLVHPLVPGTTGRQAN